MRVRNDSDKDITLSISGRTEEWKKGETLELTEGEYNLIMGSTDLEKQSARTFWEGLFPDGLPRLVPLRGKLKEE